jgi:hypothetical protein
MRFSALAGLILLAACSTEPPESARSGPEKEPADCAVAFLLASAAADFGMSQAKRPSEVRNVRAGYLEEPAIIPRFILCGEFMPQSKNGTSTWTPFVTIKTSPYEQFVGSQATSFCDNPHVTWVEDALSAELQHRLDSLP